MDFMHADTVHKPYSLTSPSFSVGHSSIAYLQDTTAICRAHGTSSKNKSRTKRSGIFL